MTHRTGTPARSLSDFKSDAHFAWCVTGSGHLLEESLALARRNTALLESILEELRKRS